MIEFPKILTQTEASFNKNEISFIGFRYQAVEISINSTEGLFLINISGKFFFFAKSIDVEKR